jgi:propionaldehyde dehydrogenase
VRAAFETKKKVFAAGPGNPPVVVDASADLDRAGEMTVKGGSFDNNLPCVAEKVAIAEARILDDYLAALERHGAHLLSMADVERLLPVVLDGEHPRRESIGQDAAELLRRAGINPKGDPRLVVALLPEDHPMVIHEQMMPFLPVVRVRDFDDALRLALQVEHGFGHTAILHSRHTDHIDRFCATMATTITVINGPSYAFAGDLGEGYATMTVTTPTGEGVTSPRTWQRRRHLVYSGFLNT